MVHNKTICLSPDLSVVVEDACLPFERVHDRVKLGQERLKSD
jgi:hypothetical protein